MNTRDTQLPDAILNLDEISVRYPGGVTALHPVNLSIQRGEITVLLGRSGAGKSSLLRSINLLVRPARGSVRCPVLGRVNTPKITRAHRRRTGMVFQQHQLIGRHTALQNVLMGRLSRFGALRSCFALPQADRESALHCLDRVGLLSKALQRADCLSGGEQQRVGVARALVMEPCLLLADEPVASLDPATSHRLLNLLRDICRNDGITLVMSLHQVDLAREFADRIIGLHEGRIVFDEPPGQLNDAAFSVIYDRAAADTPLSVEPRPDSEARSRLPGERVPAPVHTAR